MLYSQLSLHFLRDSQGRALREADGEPFPSGGGYLRDAREANPRHRPNGQGAGDDFSGYGGVPFIV